MKKLVINTTGKEGFYNSIETVYYDNTYYKGRKYTTISRYQDCFRILDEATEKTPHANMYKFSIPFTEKDIVILAKNTDRLDVLADKYYNDATFWWIIAMASDITNPFNIQTGQIIRIPPLDSIYDNNAILSRG